LIITLKKFGLDKSSEFIHHWHSQIEYLKRASPRFKKIAQEVLQFGAQPSILLVSKADCPEVATTRVAFYVGLPVAIARSFGACPQVVKLWDRAHSSTPFCWLALPEPMHGATHPAALLTDPAKENHSTTLLLTGPAKIAHSTTLSTDGPAKKKACLTTHLPGT
jgi:hypothetical protein